MVAYYTFSTYDYRNYSVISRHVLCIEKVSLYCDRKQFVVEFLAEICVLRSPEPQ